ncbi:TPA: hypothetical protein ACG3NM_003082, partial [Legionella pneumophila]
TAFSPIEKNHIKCLFEQKKEETLNRFYALASKYHNVFERLAQVQANEHNLYLKKGSVAKIFLDDERSYFGRVYTARP